MATLKKHHKEFIVKQLACFNSPGEVVELVKKTFGLKTTTSQVSYYDPENASAEGLAEKWKELFRHTRDTFMDEAVKHPIAHKGYRVGMLQKELDDLLSKPTKNYVLINQVLEQAAKEMGGTFEGKGFSVPSEGNNSTVFQSINDRIYKLNNDLNVRKN